MLFSLKDYQVQAVAQVLNLLTDAYDDYHKRDRQLAFSLTAVPSAGKTVMATAAIEALFFGSEEHQFEADKGAVVLWVTDSPSLNEQTRFRMLECGDQLDGRLITIEEHFDKEQLEAGCVYFLNTQKLGSNSRLIKHIDKRNHTVWDTIRNTIENPDLTLYVILDEAHRGMKKQTGGNSEDRPTLVRRLINGHDGIPPVPIVWGISATIERFQEAMKEAQRRGRILLRQIEIDPVEIQESGLIKDTISLDFPKGKGAFETVFLSSAIRKTIEMSALWTEQTTLASLHEEVLPLLIVQVPNTPKEADLVGILEKIHHEWPNLAPDAVANVFGEHKDLELGPFKVPYIEPQYVQAATSIRVLLAKDAISTGWDCPRAEVLCSFRPAKEHTYITQMVGRMVRSPLAKRMGDERLNSVWCFLPFFDKATTRKAAEVLTGQLVDPDDPEAAASKGLRRRVLTSPKDFLWNSNIPEEVEEVLSALPSEATPKGRVRPIQRLLHLASRIAQDELMEEPNKEATDTLCSVLDGLMAQHQKKVVEGVKAIYEAELIRLTRSVVGTSATEESHTEQTDARTVNEAFRQASRVLGAEIAKAYLKRLVEDPDDEELDIHAAKARIAALVEIPGVRTKVEADAHSLVQTWLDNLRVDFRRLSDEKRQEYEEIELQALDPQRVMIIPPPSRQENTQDENFEPLESRLLHLLADEEGNFPVGKLWPWELQILDMELAREGVVAWYRNPPSASEGALRVPYLADGRWKSMQPDFITFTRNLEGKIEASMVDPHGAYLADALPKLIGLARFAEAYRDEFVRIDAIGQTDKGELKVLDMTKPSVRKAVVAADSAKGLYEGKIARKYK